MEDPGPDEIRKNETFQTIPGRGNSTLVVDQAGFTYRKDSSNMYTHQTTWCCQKRTTLKCRARVVTIEDTIILQRYRHNHSAQ